MATATEITNVDLAAWGPGTRFYSASDGTQFVVQADLADYSELRDTIVRQPTVILYCTPTAGVTDLDVDYTFPPGTTHEAAVVGAGYTLEEAP